MASSTKKKLKNNINKIYKEPIKEEMETTINVLYKENKLAIYTNKVDLQKQLNKLIGKPVKEYKIKRSVVGSLWEISLDDKSKIQKIIVKANVYELWKIFIWNAYTTEYGTFNRYLRIFTKNKTFYEIDKTVYTL